MPISPVEYKNDDYYMWRYLDRIVTWAGENDNYVILDWDYTDVYKRQEALYIRESTISRSRDITLSILVRAERQEYMDIMI